VEKGNDRIEGESKGREREMKWSWWSWPRVEGGEELMDLQYAGADVGRGTS